MRRRDDDLLLLAEARRLPLTLALRLILRHLVRLVAVDFCRLIGRLILRLRLGLASRLLDLLDRAILRLLLVILLLVAFLLLPRLSIHRLYRLRRVLVCELRHRRSPQTHLLVFGLAVAGHELAAEPVEEVVDVEVLHLRLLADLAADERCDVDVDLLVALLLLLRLLSRLLHLAGGRLRELQWLQLLRFLVGRPLLQLR